MKNARLVYMFTAFFLAACLMSTVSPAMAVTNGADALGLHWLMEITNETVQAEYSGGPDAGKLGPYLQILAQVRQAALVGDRSKISEGMNRYLSMLIAKEKGISAKTATRLFDTAYELIPARYIDSQRFKQQYETDIKPYLDKFREDEGGRG